MRVVHFLEYIVNWLGDILVFLIFLIGIIEILRRLFNFIVSWVNNYGCHEDEDDEVYVLARFGGIQLKFRIGDLIYMKYTVPADHQDEPFSIEPITGGADSEGNAIPASDFSIDAPMSSDDAVVSIVDDGNGGSAFHFGAPGAALVSAQPRYLGEPFGTPITVEFAVHAGAPVSITGGGVSIPGLTPDA